MAGKGYLCAVGKRNIRIRRDQLARRLSELPGEEIHVILLGGTTYNGKCVEAKAGEIVLRDANARWTSLRRHTHRISTQDVLEVIFDKVTDY